MSVNASLESKRAHPDCRSGNILFQRRGFPVRVRQKENEEEKNGKSVAILFDPVRVFHPKAGRPSSCTWRIVERGVEPRPIQLQPWRLTSPDKSCAAAAETSDRLARDLPLALALALTLTLAPALLLVRILLAPAGATLVVTALLPVAILLLTAPVAASVALERVSKG